MVSSRPMNAAVLLGWLPWANRSAKESNTGMSANRIVISRLADRMMPSGPICDSPSRFRYGIGVLR